MITNDEIRACTLVRIDEALPKHIHDTLLRFEQSGFSRSTMPALKAQFNAWLAERRLIIARGHVA